jgi:hypothetical protein
MALLVLLLVALVSSSLAIPSPLAITNATNSTQTKSFDFSLDEPSNLFPIYMNGALNVSSQGQPTLSLNSTSVDLLSQVIGTFLQSILGGMGIPDITQLRTHPSVKSKKLQATHVNSTTVDHSVINKNNLHFRLNGTLSVQKMDSCLTVFNKSIDISN